MVIFHVDYTINDSHPKSPLKSQITIQITGHVVFFVPFSEISQVLAFPVYAGLSPGRLLALAPLGSALLAAWPAKPSTARARLICLAPWMGKGGVPPSKMVVSWWFHREGWKMLVSWCFMAGIWWLKGVETMGNVTMKMVVERELNHEK